MAAPGPQRRDGGDRRTSDDAARPIVIGAGVNGLAAAFYLARAGLRPIVLERGRVGGAASTREMVPGFRVPDSAHAVGPIRQDVADAMGLASHGVQLAAARGRQLHARPGRPGARAVSRSWHAAARRSRSSRRATPPAIRSSFVTSDPSAAVVLPLLAEVPPSIDTPTTGSCGSCSDRPALPPPRTRAGVSRASLGADARRRPADDCSRPSCCAPPSPREASSAPNSARDPPAPRRRCSSRGRVSPRRPWRPSSCAADQVSWHPRWPRRRRPPAPRSGVALSVVRIDVDDAGVRGVTLANGEQIAAHDGRLERGPAAHAARARRSACASSRTCCCECATIARAAPWPRSTS